MKQLAVLTLVLMAITAAKAQTGNGVVRGMVFDPAKAAVPSAKVELMNLGTNIANRVVSSTSGDYYFGNVQPGRYRLTVELPGFRKWVGTLTLEAGQNALVDVPMEVGDLSTTVTVEGAATPITVASAEISDVKDALRIQQLPLNGRDITSLFILTPGVEGGSNPRVNGLKVGSVEMLLDGVSLVDRFGGGINRTRPGLDTIEEFRIETTGSSARYSRPATVTLVTKSGTNALHGTAFETHRNNWGGLRARQRQDGPRPSRLVRNEFGASAGGPVTIPGLYRGKDRTFWFFAYEGLEQRTLNFTRGNTPTAAMWGGNFDNIVDTAGFKTNIYDPLSTNAQGVRMPFAGNIIGAARLSEFSRTMRSVSPDPSNAINPYQAANFEQYYSNLLSTNTLTSRGDHRFSDKDSVFGRFTRSRRLNELDGGRFGNPRPGTRSFGTGLSNSLAYNTSVTWNHTFSPTLLNELLLGAFRAPHRNGTLADDIGWADKLGLPNPFGVTGWPTLGAGLFAWDADNRSNQHLTHFIVEDNGTKIKGKHSLTFGIKLRREDNNIRELQQAQGSHNFGAAWTALYNPAGDQAVARTGDGLASLLLGLPNSLSNQFNRGYFYFQQKETGLYVHDNWKVSRRLTLDLGLRWDRWSPYTEKLNRLLNVDASSFANKFEVITPRDVRMESMQGIPPAVLASWARRGLSWKTANEAGFPGALLPADNNNFGPRIGAAYRLNDKWVIRASYGEYFWTMPLSQILQSARTNPPLNLRYTNPIGSLDTTATFAVRTAPRPEFFIGRANVDANGIILLPNTAQAFRLWDHRDWKDNRAQAWHFTLERELMRNTGLRMSYIGDHGRDLEQKFGINSLETEYNYQARTGLARPAVTDLRRVNPNWNFDQPTNHSGYSNTHSLQAEVERKYSNGLAFQWFYTFTRSLTTTDSDGFSAGSGSFNSGTADVLAPEGVSILGAPKMTYDERLRLGYQNSTRIPAHRVRYNVIWDLPFGSGKLIGRSAGRGLNRLIGDWQLASIGDWRSGNWLSVGSGSYLFGDPTLSAGERLSLTFNGRPQRLWWRGFFTPTQASNVDQQALQRLVPLNPADRIYRPVGANFDNQILQPLANGATRLTPIGDNVNWNARGFFRGPGSWNLDASLFKTVNITETFSARFTVDFFNFLNHPVDVDPAGGTGLQDLSLQGNEPRIIQFSLRIRF